jgi:hypothetical protein
MAPRSPSLAGRAFLALGLMIGFYVLAMTIAFGLLYLPYAEVVYAKRLHFKLALFCVIGAGVILWSIIPRPDRFLAQARFSQRRASPGCSRQFSGSPRARARPCPRRCT